MATTPTHHSCGEMPLEDAMKEWSKGKEILENKGTEKDQYGIQTPLLHETSRLCWGWVAVSKLLKIT